MITRMPRHAVIAFRVTCDTKTTVRRLAQREGVTESRLVKQLLDPLLRASAGDGSASPFTPDPINRRARLYVRLASEDWRLLKERAAARGLPAATYVALLTRSRLRAATPLPNSEYLALRAAIAEMSAIGRNLNQIAREINLGGTPQLPGREAVRAMITVATKFAITSRNCSKPTSAPGGAEMARRLVNLGGGRALLDIGSYGRSGPRERFTAAQLELISLTVRRTPEVMVKMLNRGGRTRADVGRHLSYLDRDGGLTIEADDGRGLRGKEAAASILDDWDLDLDEQRPTASLDARRARPAPKLVHKIVFSMPAGTRRRKSCELSGALPEMSSGAGTATRWSCTRMSPIPTCTWL